MQRILSSGLEAVKIRVSVFIDCPQAEDIHSDNSFGHTHFLPLSQICALCFPITNTQWNVTGIIWRCVTWGVRSPVAACSGQRTKWRCGQLPKRRQGLEWVISDIRVSKDCASCVAVRWCFNCSDFWSIHEHELAYFDSKLHHFQKPSSCWFRPNMKTAKLSGKQEIKKGQWINEWMDGWIDAEADR
jgi:hypothetical protein